MTAKRRVVITGLGVATVPRSAMPPEGHPVLVSLPLNNPEVTRTVGVIRKRGPTLSPLAERFHQLLRKVAEIEKPT